MIKLTLTEICAAVGGTLIGHDQNIDVEQLCTDSRKLQAGDLFLALKGPNFDGHKFAEQAEQIGCVGAIVSEKQNVNIAQIVVADTHQALGQISAYVKQCVAPKTVAITGSSGKTTVKEMIAAILSPLGRVLATKGNFNNDIGVPLTLLDLQQNDDFAVVELGANHQGEIDYTTHLTKPDVAIINNIAAAHLEGFGSLQGVAKAKGEIFSGLSENGTAIYNLDTPHTDEWQWRLKGKNVITFSAEKHTQEANVYASDIVLDSKGCASFVLHCEQGHVDIRLNLPGKHNVGNSLAAAAAAIKLGATLADVRLGLLSMSPVKGRVNVKHLSKSIVVIDDTYNANVESTKAAIELLASYGTETILVLGDFGELGVETEKYHKEIGEYALTRGVDSLLSLGEYSKHSSAVFDKQGQHFNDHIDLSEQLAIRLINKEKEITVLVKGSRSAKMELVISALQEKFVRSLNNKDASC